ncbi:hypothetical protein MHYP_G00102400 [Metynnis hypsauchen]
MTIELHVEAPEEVTEGETADLTCKTTCSLTDPTFIWYKDGCPLTTKTIKNNQLHLQTVSSEDAGSYSCAGRGDQHLRSTAHSLRVRCRSSSAVWFAVGGGSFLLITVLICICRINRKKRRSDKHDDENADPDAQDDTYTALQPRSSDDVYHTLATKSSSPDDPYTALDPQSRRIGGFPGQLSLVDVEVVIQGDELSLEGGICG